MFEGAVFSAKNDLSSMLDTSFLGLHRVTIHRATAIQTLDQSFALITEDCGSSLAAVYN